MSSPPLTEQEEEEEEEEEEDGWSLNHDGVSIDSPATTDEYLY